MNLKSKKKILKLLIILASFLFFTNMFIMPVRADPLTKTTYIEQWIQNPDFIDNTNWISEIIGDVTDVNNNISAGQANFNIQGETYTITLISGTPNSSTSEGWYNNTNPEIPVYPTQGYEINKYGCFASHLWAEQLGTTTNAYQKTSVQWEKVITTPQNMSDYTITNATLDVKINATAKSFVGCGSGDVWHWEGVEAVGDTTGVDRFIEGDYIKFFVRLSNLDKDVNYKVAQYQTTTLGQDGAEVNGSYDYLNDMVFHADNLEDLIFFLNQVLENGDYQNFIIILGMEFNCEDNCSTDLDEFTGAYFKSCNFTISYIKNINKLTTASWKYLGNPIDNKGGAVEINYANLQFDYKISKEWPEDLSPNSEIRILVNDNEHTESIGLKFAEENFRPAKIGGFEIGNLIPNNEEINLSIQVFLADDFNLNEDITISIDNVILNISYDIFLPTRDNSLFIILLIVALTCSGLLGGYFVYYRLVLRFPRQVRKVRKFRRTLNKKAPPNVSIKSQQKAFSSNYNKELKKTSNVVTLKLPTKTVSKIPKSNSSKENIELAKKLGIIFMIIIGLVFIPMIGYFFPNYVVKNKILGINMLQVQNPLLFNRISHQEQWIENSNFDINDNWSMFMEGDTTDLSLDINNSSANYEIIGDYGTQHFYEDGTSANWTRLQNEDNIVLPDYFDSISSGGSGMDNRGWYSYFFWPDNQPQSVKVQWMKNFTMNVNMSDYYITSASLEAWINGTVDDSPVNGGGIDRPGDTLAGGTTVQIATGDFARFFIMISDVDRNREFIATQYQTDDLGKDGPPGITQLNDTLITPINEETLIFYLEQALQYDHQNFAITLGMYFWCEDSGHPGDSDDWQMMIFKNFSLSISYEKKINQFNTGSWTYHGKQIEANGYRVEIRDAKLKFETKLNTLWPSDLSPNSKFKILINGVEHNETVRLSDIGTIFQNVSETGFDVGRIIPNHDAINVTIQVFLADEFALSENIKISIDNVSLWISYDIFIPIKEFILYEILFILACIGIGGLASYVILYQRIFKYPKPVRKVRKFRKSLHKEKTPEIPIVSQEFAFKHVYNQEVAKISQDLNTNLLLHKGDKAKSKDTTMKSEVLPQNELNEKINSEELITKSLEKKEELDKIIKDSIGNELNNGTS